MTPNLPPAIHRKRILIVLILTFASIADLMVLLIMGKGLFGLYKFFLIYGILFMLQDSFSWFRKILIVLLLGVAFVGFSKLLLEVDPNYIQALLFNKIIVPAVLPLLAAMCCIAMLTGLFLRKYKVFR